MGLYQHGTGELVYYSEGPRDGHGAQWFYEMSSGKPSLYAADGQLFWRDGTPFRDLA